MKSSKKWLQLLFSFLESQLSNSVFGKPSYLEEQLHEDNNIHFLFPNPDINTPDISKEEKIELLSNALHKAFSLDPSLSEEASQSALSEARSRLITFKDEYFDQPRKIIKPKIADALGQGGISIWKPVWEYLISQIDDLHKFEGKQFWLVPEKQMYVKTQNSTQRLLSVIFGKQVYVESENLIKRQLCSIVGKSSLLTSREKILETLFPKKELIMSNLAGYYYSMGKSVFLARINPFFDEEVGVLYHQKLIDKKLNPVYLQFGNAVEVFERDIQNDRSKKIISKSERINPLIYFEEGEVVFIPYEEAHDNKIMDRLMNIDITSLNGLDIINEYLRKKFQLDIDIDA